MEKAKRITTLKIVCKYIIILLIALGLLKAIIVATLTIIDPCGPYRAVCSESFKGRIIDKYTDRIQFMEIDTGGGIYTISSFSYELDSIGKIGDSIEKITGENRCYLYTNGSKMLVKYKWVSSRCDLQIP